LHGIGRRPARCRDPCLERQDIMDPNAHAHRGSAVQPSHVAALATGGGGAGIGTGIRHFGHMIPKDEIHDQPLGRGRADMKAPDCAGGVHGRVRRGLEVGKEKYSGSWAEYLWRRLDAVDFMNQAMLLAATFLLCAVPFLLIASALAGRSVVPALTRRLGLSHEASADLGHLFTSSSATSGAVTGLSWVFFILAGIAGASAIQLLYLRVFQLAPQKARDTLHAVIWLVLVVGWMFLFAAVDPWLRGVSLLLFWMVNLVAYIGWWWFTMWFLLARRVSWRRLYPCAVATGAFWTGMYAVFSIILSGMITSYDQKYGPIGIIFALTSLFIAIGVVIILGAAVGLMWQDRGLSFRAAVAKRRRAS
jgi:membrane protein